MALGDPTPGKQSVVSAVKSDAGDKKKPYSILSLFPTQVFITEYGIVVLTFLAIQFVGIDAGIIVGVIFAVVDHVVLTATTSTITKVYKRSRAIWTKEENKILHNYAYNIAASPKIATLELTGTIFFGSALQSLNRIIDETNVKDDSPPDDILQSPRTPHAPSLMSVRKRRGSESSASLKETVPSKRPPKFLVLDLLYVTHLDASATRGCFLQLVKICAKQGIIVCASGVTPRIEWMFRTHGVAYPSADEGRAIAARLQSHGSSRCHCDQALLFVSIQDALEFCESAILHEYKEKRQMPIIPSLVGPKQQSFTNVIAKILKASDEEKAILSRLEEERYHEEKELKSGEVIFHKDIHSDSFYIVLQGTVANNSGSARAVDRLKQEVFSGAGRVGSRTNLMESVFLEPETRPNRKDSADVAAMTWGVGSVVGFLDYLLDRPRLFRLISIKDGTRVAQITNSQMNLLKADDPELYALIQRVLLHAATSDLANCTCNYE